MVKPGLVVIENSEDRALKDAAELLTGCLGKGYRQVLVLGLRGNGTFEMQASRTLDAIQTLGAIEHLKHHVLDGWRDK